jgi:hypothetical protein
MLKFSASLEKSIHLEPVIPFPGVGTAFEADGGS